MDLFFINVADQTSRRRFVEDNFKANNAAGWRLHRIEAATPRTLAGRGVPGPIRDAEKACFLSHIEAIGTCRQYDGPAFIAEDDILFGSKSFPTIDGILKTVPEDSWDIIFTDVLIPDSHTMIDCLQERRRITAEGGPAVINLRNAKFAGSTAYIVNGRAKEKIVGLLPPDGPFDLPYDLFLRRLIRNDLLRAFLIFPFATTVSSFGAESQIQLQADDAKGTQFIWNSFRQLMWAERDTGLSLAAAERIMADVKDAETIALSRMIAGMLLPGFRGRRG